jgi:hypothetical protein
MRRVLLVLALCLPARPEIVDRLAVTLDHQVISLSDILTDIRVTAFLNQQQPDFTAAGKKASAERLIQQALLRREMDQSHYPAPKPEESAQLLAQVTARFHSREEYLAALAQRNLTEQQVQAHLLWELTTVRFVDYRFAPGVEIPQDDIKAYYEKRVSEWKANGVDPIPSLTEARDQIEEILQKERANQALDLWIGEARTQLAISYHEDALR